MPSCPSRAACDALPRCLPCCEGIVAPCYHPTRWSGRVLCLEVMLWYQRRGDVIVPRYLRSRYHAVVPASTHQLAEEVWMPGCDLWAARTSTLAAWVTGRLRLHGMRPFRCAARCAAHRVAPPASPACPGHSDQGDTAPTIT